MTTRPPHQKCVLLLLLLLHISMLQQLAPQLNECVPPTSFTYFIWQTRSKSSPFGVSGTQTRCARGYARAVSLARLHTAPLLHCNEKEKDHPATTMICVLFLCPSPVVVAYLFVHLRCGRGGHRVHVCKSFKGLGGWKCVFAGTETSQARASAAQRERWSKWPC